VTLPNYNPCRQAGGKWVEGELDGGYGYRPFSGAQYWGLTAMIHFSDITPDINGVSQSHFAGIGQNGNTGWAGATYQDASECLKRAKRRAGGKYLFGLFFHDPVTKLLEIMKLGAGWVCELIPQVKLAPTGAGAESDFAPAICNKTVDLISRALWWFNWQWKEKETQIHNHLAALDCNAASGSHMRIFCDLHCVRDAVKAGTDNILTTLVDNFKILQTNFDMLMEYYAGTFTDAVKQYTTEVEAGTGGSSAAMVERSETLRKHLSGNFAEMQHLLRSELHGSARETVTRALNSFKLKWAGATAPTNASQMMHKMAADTNFLLRTIRYAWSEPASKAGNVVRRVLQSLVQTRSDMKLKSTMIDFQQHSAQTGKKRQEQLSFDSGSINELSEEIRQLGTNALIMDFDRSWWTIRERLDAYFDSAENQNVALENAMQVMIEYTSMCTKKCASSQGSSRTCNTSGNSRAIPTSPHMGDRSARTWTLGRTHD
jgi:hypothetical protein